MRLIIVFCVVLNFALIYANILAADILKFVYLHDELCKSHNYRVNKKFVRKFRFVKIEIFLRTFVIWVFIFEYQNFLCPGGDLFSDPLWVPALERCSVECNFMDEICMRSVAAIASAEKCRRCESILMLTFSNFKV